MIGFLALSLLPLLASASPIISLENDAAPILSSAESLTIPDSYIVVFKEHVSRGGAASHHTWVQDLHLQTENNKAELRRRSLFPSSMYLFGGLKHTYDVAGALLGYSGHFDDDVIEQVRRHPDVSLLIWDYLNHYLI